MRPEPAIRPGQFGSSRQSPFRSCSRAGIIEDLQYKISSLGCRLFAFTRQHKHSNWSIILLPPIGRRAQSLQESPIQQRGLRFGRRGWAQIEPNHDMFGSRPRRPRSWSNGRDTQGGRHHPRNCPFSKTRAIPQVQSRSYAGGRHIPDPRRTSWYRGEDELGLLCFHSRELGEQRKRLGL